MVSCSRKRSSRKSTCTSDLSTSALTNSSTSSGPTSRAATDVLSGRQSKPGGENRKAVEHAALLGA